MTRKLVKGQILWDTGWLESHLDLRFDMEITNRYFLYYSYLLSEAQLIAPRVKIRDARKPVWKRLQTRVSKGRDVPRDVPGQTGTGRPAVPLSRDKDIFLVPVSLCPGTRAWVNVPGQTPLSRDVPGQNYFPILLINCIIFLSLFVVAIFLSSCTSLFIPLH